MQIGLLISGELGFLVLTKLVENYKISFLLTDKKSENIIQFCNANKISFFAGNPRGKDVMQTLNKPECDLIISANYLFLVGPDVYNYPRKMAINFHGSLLPKYRGRTPHVWAIINNEKETGITAHLIDEHCDTGHIIAQIKIPIKISDTGADLLKTYSQIYPHFITEVIESVEKNTVTFSPQDNTKATVFGKRTPEDGRINWDWQKERIFNWVRGQAKPYPGSFSFVRDQKCTIHKIEFSSFGFNNEIENGKIIGFENTFPIVKTPNGCVKIIDCEVSTTILINDILI